VEIEPKNNRFAIFSMLHEETVSKPVALFENKWRIEVLKTAT